MTAAIRIDSRKDVLAACLVDTAGRAVECRSIAGGSRLGARFDGRGNSDGSAGE